MSLLTILAVAIVVNQVAIAGLSVPKVVLNALQIVNRSWLVGENTKKVEGNQWLVFASKKFNMVPMPATRVLDRFHTVLGTMDQHPVPVTGKLLFCARCTPSVSRSNMSLAKKIVIAADVQLRECVVVDATKLAFAKQIAVQAQVGNRSMKQVGRIRFINWTRRTVMESRQWHCRMIKKRAASYYDAVCLGRQLSVPVSVET